MANIFSSNHLSLSRNPLSGPLNYISQNNIDQIIQTSELANKTTSVNLSKHAPPIPQFLDANEIHIWKAELDRDQLLIENFQKIISKDEQIRAK